MPNSKPPLLKHSSSTNVVIACIAFTFLSFASASAGILEGPVTNTANGHTYYLLTQNTWTASQSEATRLGGHLATVRNAAEQSWIYQTFSGTKRNLWIGAVDFTGDGVFRWISDEPISYTNWAPGEP
jgi:hypothetical protein